MKDTVNGYAGPILVVLFVLTMFALLIHEVGGILRSILERL